jgi:hypothetical protein
MKLLSGVMIFIALAFSSNNLSAQTLWYYSGSGALNNTASWATNSAGTSGLGTLTDFTSGGRYFIIQNTTAVSLTGVWNIGNTNFASAGGDSLIVGNPSTPGAAITLTLLSGSSITVNKSKTISVSVPSSGNHKLIYKNSGNGLSFGTIYDPNFEIVFDGATITSSSTNSFGDLSLINNAVVDMGGANAKFRNITVDNGSTLSGPIGASSNFLGIRAGGTVTINGTFRAGRTGGLATTTSVSVFPVTTTTTAANSTSTNATAATTASTTGLTRTVTCASTSNLQVGDIITIASGTGAFPAGTFVRSITSATVFVASAAATTQLSAATISTSRFTLPVSSSAGITVGGALAKNSGTGAFAASSVVTGIVNGTTLAISAAPTTAFATGASITVSFAAATSWSTLVFEDFTPNLILGSNSTIDFNRGTSGQTAAQSIDTLSYANLILSNSGAASNKLFIAGTMNVSGSFTVSNLLGTITQPSSTTINLTGSSAQTIPSQLTTFSVLGISGGTKTMSGNVSVSSSLNLTSGILNTTSAYTLTVTSVGTVTRTSGWVNGNLNRNINVATNTSRVFNVGDATNYAPITLTFANVTTQGNLTVSTATPLSGVANASTAPISSTAYVNRYWNVSNPSAFAYTGTYTAAMTYVNGDIVGGATSSSLITAQNVAGTWSKPSTSGVTNVSTASGLTSIGSLVLANDCITVTPSISISSTTVSFCTGTNATFTATPTNGGSSPTYQWKNNGNNIGTNSATLVLNAANVANADVITCVMTANNICQTSATATSNGLTLAVGGTVTPSVLISTAKDTVCSGSNTVFTAVATNGGSSPSYQWKKNGVDAGSGSTITFLSNTLSNNDVITCVLTANNVCQTTATAFSNSIQLIVKQSPAVAQITNGISTITSASLCTLGSTYKYYDATPYGTWSSTNPAVASVTGGSQAGVVTANTNGTATISYSIAATNGCVSTSSVALTVAQQTAPTAISGTNSICVNATTTLSSTAPIGTTGVWSSSNDRGIISVDGDYTGKNAGTWGEARYTVTNASGCKAFASYAITVNPTPVVPTITYAPGTVGNPQAGAPTGSFCVGKKFRVVATPNVPAGVWSATGSASFAGYDTVKINAVGAGSIKYTYTSAAGCVSSRIMSATGYTCASRGVSVSSEGLVVSGDFTMYPNPAKGYINLNVETLVGAGSIVVTDLYGKIVKTQNLSMGTNTVNISNLSKGMFFISTITNEGKVTKKLIVE